ncbi:regulator of chromosome condensation-like [Stylophora pistillata]|uniref:Regulator of chromosome condensation n=1 Tax=Stylophora pistillata TaxID=50429 RepID=A0A2B4SGG9_STYPI|nr:regulator of chromosome condensation-like [Stylophora pistillata]PFX27678.1 Regulator of chromosome condensation [Stylophora pistillata]
MPARKRQTSKRKAEEPAKDAVNKKKDKREAASVDQREVGHVLTLGQGDVGQLGLGEDTLERKKPAIVKGLDDLEIVQVECGGMHTVALTDSGKVYTWGCNDEGALGRVTSSENGEEFTAGPVQDIESVNVVMVSAGDSHTMALSDQGTVYGWGTYRDASGQVGLQADGVKHKPTVILTLQNNPIIKIASGNDHTVALTKDGNIFTWGCAEQGQLGRIMGCFTSRGGRRGLQYILNPKQVRDKKRLTFKDIFCGSYSTFAVSQYGAVYAWGLNNYGQLGTGDLETLYAPTKVEALTSLISDNNKCVSIASGQHHTIVLDSSGKVYAMGRAEYGRLGLGEDAKETTSPVLVAALEWNPICKIACGEAVSLAVSSKGDLYSWGFGSCLQLGTGEDEDEFSPVKVEGKNLQSELHEVLGVSAGGQHTALLVKDRK